MLDAWGDSDGGTVTGGAEVVTPGAPAPDERWVPGDDDDVAQPAGGGGGEPAGPICHYEPLRATTQEQQRTEYRPEEQRPGAWGWLACDDGTWEFRFFPEATPAAPDAGAPIDPAVLAATVELTPTVPQLRASPPLDTNHLVALDTWFWIDSHDWAPVADGTGAGPVTVNVTATPATLVIDPGDGSPAIACPGGGTPYDPDLPTDAQASGCTHTYQRSGTYTATVTVTYDTSWTSNIDPGPHPLDAITPPPVPITIHVAEAQALNTD